MTTFWRKVTGLALLAIPAAACLIKDTTQTWYLHPDGSVTWTVVESDIRSDARAPADRANEETTYWAAVRSETHPVAQALKLLGPANLRTRIVRGDVPYTVITDAKFPAIAELGRRLITQMGLAGSSELGRDAGAWQWTLTIRDPHASESQPETDGGIWALADSLDTLKIVLVAGRFESAEGFTLSDDRRVAVFDEKATNPGRESPMMVLRLRWVEAVK